MASEKLRVVEHNVRGALYAFQCNTATTLVPFKHYQSMHGNLTSPTATHVSAHTPQQASTRTLPLPPNHLETISSVAALEGAHTSTCFGGSSGFILPRCTHMSVSFARGKGCGGIPVSPELVEGGREEGEGSSCPESQGAAAR